MKTWVLLLFSMLLGACASAPPPPNVHDLFADELFAPPGEVIDDDIFAPSEAMRSFVSATVRDAARLKGPREALLDALGKEAQLKLSYDTLYTRNAAQAFQTRSGNCLSLVIMTASFADILGLPIQFNTVLVDESWTRSDNLYFASGHVNLSIARAPIAERTGYDTAAMVTIDFLPPDELRGQRKRSISRDTVRAMYLNNRAAESLVAQRIDDAYWWARKAVEQVPASPMAYNTLGVVYLRRNAVDQAVAVLQYALAREPDNTKALFNLAQALERQGQAGQAAELRIRLAELETYPPFRFFDLGQAALKRGDFAAARDHFAREVQRNADFHESHFGLAMAHFGLGDIDAAQKHLRLALENSSTQAQREIYSAKFAHLRARLQR